MLTLVSYNIYKSSFLLGEKRHESWYGHNLWHYLFDLCMQTIPGITAERGEIPTNASRSRLAQLHRRYHTKPQYKPGPRADAVYRRTQHGHSQIEHGASEISPKYMDSKCAADTIKIVRLMRDFIARINRYTNGCEEVLRGVVVFGVVCHGPSFRVLYMTCPSGNTTVLRSGPDYTIPAQIHEFGRMGRIFSAILGLRDIVVRNEALIQKAETRPGSPSPGGVRILWSDGDEETGTDEAGVGDSNATDDSVTGESDTEVEGGDEADSVPDCESKQT